MTTMHDRRKWLGAMIVVSAGLAVAYGPAVAGESLKRFEIAEPHMGTRFRIILHAADEATAKRASAAAFLRIAELDGIMSDYQATSELMRLCAKAGGEAVPVSADLFDVLSRSQEISRQTDGAFDATVGPVVRLWRLSRRTQRLPDPQKLAAARALIGYENVVLDPKARAVTLKKSGMQLDLGGIAKGFAAEEAQAVLKKEGITRALVAASGDIVVSGPPPDSDAWTVGIGAVSEDEKTAPTLHLHDAAVSTSGDAFQYVEIGGKRYAHIVDPSTGMGITDIYQVTVVARDGTTSDALATALVVMGVEKGMKLVESMDGVSARFVRKTASGIEEKVSRRFPAFVAK
jgi:thiamine biosynthesis lipoprotein